MNKSVITYMPPKDKFLMVGKGIVSKFEPEVIGIYCKIIQLSGGMSLTISFIADKIKVSVKKVRRVIVELEDAGYVVRDPLKDERGSFAGWNYRVFAEPVPVDKRSHAGRKSDLTETGLDRNRTYPKTDKSENGKENILSNTNVLSNNTETLDNIEKKVLSNDNTKKVGVKELSEEERKYQERMREMFPRIMKMDQPLTLEQGKKLKEMFSDDEILQAMEEIENWKPLLTKRVNAFMTIKNWILKNRDRQ